MKNLLELFQIIRKGNPDKIELLNKTLLTEKNNTKFAQFYKGLLSGKIKSDLEAAQLIYNTSETDVKYRQLKSRFRKRLLNTLLLLDPSFSSEEVVGNKDDYIYAQRQWTLILIAHRHKAQQAVDSMARNLLHFCEKRGFHQLSFEISHFLWTQAVAQKDQKRAVEYDVIRKKHKAFYMARLEAEEIFLKYQLDFDEGKKELQGIRQATTKLIQLAERYPSASVYYYMYRLWVLHYYASGNFRAMAQISSQAYRQLIQFPHWTKTPQVAVFYTLEMTAYWALKDMQAAIHLAERVFKEVDQEAAFWLEFMEMYLLTALYTKNYERAVAIYKKAEEYLVSVELDVEKREKWLLYEAYLCFLTSYCKPGEELDLRLKQGPRFFRYLPIKHLKRQWEVILLLLQIAQKKKNGALLFLKSSVASKQKSNFAKRRSLFLKLLERLYIADYRHEKLRLTEKYYKQLRSLPPMFSVELRYLEIVPFHDLWEVLLERLEIRSW